MIPFIPFSVFDAPAPPAPHSGDFSLSLTTPKAIKTSKMGRFAKLIALFGLLLILVSWGPSLFLRVMGEASHYQLNASSLPVVPSNYQPAFDRNLPLENSIKISSIGVDGPIYEAQKDDYESALRRGFWRVTDFGTPFDRSLPTIVVAHRFGYLSWDNLFRRHNSFFNLPKLKIGDTIEIIWNQRKYTYAVYAEDTAKEISDYSADLILYTCEDLSSDVKVFKFAKLLEI